MKEAELLKYEGDGELLLQEGTWALWSTGDLSGKVNLLHSYIVHGCAEFNYGDGNSFWWSMLTIDRQCASCQKYPATAVMTLWKLHNWDYIQSGGDLR